MYKVKVGRIIYKDNLTQLEAQRIKKELQQSVKGVKIIRDGEG